MVIDLVVKVLSQHIFMVLNSPIWELNFLRFTIPNGQVFHIDEVENLIDRLCYITGRPFLLTDPLEIERA